MARESNEILEKVKNGEHLGLREQTKLLLLLSFPAILSQLTVILMQYIDASMVGSLGANASAAIGLVSTSTWLLGGICSSIAGGFSVQIAHRIGARENQEARAVVRQALALTMAISVAIGLFTIVISPFLPHWLGGGDEICADASAYFLVFGLSVPFCEMTYLSAGMLRCAGNMRVPAIISIVGCFLNVGFNALFIFVLQWGVLGAALGSLCSMAISSIYMFVYTLTRSELRLENLWERVHFEPHVLRKAFHIGGPMAMEHIVMCSAQICSTMIVAPLGTIAIAANAFGIIIEGLCYMPGYGIGDAATTLVGQSIGAQRRDLQRSFAWLSMGLGMAFMTFMGIVMYVGIPYLMPLMTPDALVRDLTVSVLRIEAFAEPMYAASIVAYGVFVGTGDTLMPCIMNLGSIWVVRIPLALVLSRTMGLKGVWMAMAIELCFRGLIFIVRLINNNNENNFRSRIWRGTSLVRKLRYRIAESRDSRG